MRQKNTSLFGLILRNVLLFALVSPLIVGVLITVVFAFIQWHFSHALPPFLMRRDYLWMNLFASNIVGAIPAAFTGASAAIFSIYCTAISARHGFSLIIGAMSFVVFCMLTSGRMTFAPNISSGILDITLPALGGLACSAISVKCGLFAPKRQSSVSQIF